MVKKDLSYTNKSQEFLTARETHWLWDCRKKDTYKYLHNKKPYVLISWTFGPYQ